MLNTLLAISKCLGPTHHSDQTLKIQRPGIEIYFHGSNAKFFVSKHKNTYFIITNSGVGFQVPEHGLPISFSNAEFHGPLDGSYNISINSVTKALLFGPPLGYVRVKPCSAIHRTLMPLRAEPTLRSKYLRISQDQRTIREALRLNWLQRISHGKYQLTSLGRNILTLFDNAMLQSCPWNLSPISRALLQIPPNPCEDCKTPMPILLPYELVIP